jgi:hypothetical protein
MYAKRVDVNQQDVVLALRFFGATVVVTSHVGVGFPDLIVGYHGRTFLLEVKDGKKGAAAKLTPAQEKWIKNWQGEPVFVARSAAEAVAFVCGFVPEGEPWKKGAAE